MILESWATICLFRPRKSLVDIAHPAPAETLLILAQESNHPTPSPWGVVDLTRCQCAIPHMTGWQSGSDSDNVLLYTYVRTLMNHCTLVYNCTLCSTHKLGLWHLLVLIYKS